MRKIDYIQRALSAIGISGITSPADNEDLNLAFEKLESFVYELESRNIDISWNHETDINGESGPVALLIQRLYIALPSGCRLIIPFL